MTVKMIDPKCFPCVSYEEVLSEIQCLNRHSGKKNLPGNARDSRGIVLIPGLERSPGEGNGIPLHYSCLGNPMDRRDWQATVQGVAQRQA